MSIRRRTTAPRDNYIGKPPGYGKEKGNAYIANDYHEVTDTVRPDWDLSGPWNSPALRSPSATVSHRAGLFRNGLPGAEFKAKRDAMMKATPEKQKKSRHKRVRAAASFEAGSHLDPGVVKAAFIGSCSVRR